MALSKIQGAQIETPVDISAVNITGVGTITNATITNLTGTAGTVTTLRSTTLNADTGNIVTGVVTNFTSTNGSITNLTGTSSTITTLRSTTLNVDTGNIVTGVTTNFNSTNVVITGVTTVSAGTAALPSITPSGDPNTGVFFPSADHLNFSTGGTSRVQIESDGDINIDSGGLFYDAANNRFGVGTTNPGSYNVNTDDLVIVTSGNTGITIVSSTTGLGQLAFADGTTAADAYRGLLMYDHNSNFMAIYTDAMERMRITAAGLMGIGTLTPSTALQVNGTVTATAFSGAVSLTDVASTGTNLTIDNATPQRTIASISLTSGVWFITGTWSGSHAAGLGSVSAAQKFGLNTAASFSAASAVYNNDSIVSPTNQYVCAQSSLCFIATVSSTTTWYLYGGPSSISNSLICVLSGTIRAVKLS